MNNVSNEELLVALDSLHQDQKEIKRMFGSIQKSLDLIYEHFEIMTDLQEDVKKVHRAVVNAANQNETLSEGIKQTVEIQSSEVKVTVQEETEGAKEEMKTGLLDDIQKTFKRKNIHQKGWWDRLTHRSNNGTTKTT